MFTGIIEAVGEISDLSPTNNGISLTVNTGKMDISDTGIGDSIAVCGACLTVVSRNNKTFQADVSNETLAMTTLGQFKKGTRVNLERALMPTSRLGGHMVSGHVDGVGELQELVDEGSSWRLLFQVPESLACYISRKGSICIDGVSLTVNQVNDSAFSVNIIPHTQEQTIIYEYQPGRQVNIEVDLISRYIERLIQNRTEAHKIDEDSIDISLLQKAGFIPES